MLQNRNHCLPGVPITFHNYIKNIMSLSGMVLPLWLAHTKSPMSCLYLKNMLKEEVISGKESLMPCFIMTILKLYKMQQIAIL